MKCLIADDESSIRQLLVRLLTSRGHACTAVATARDLERSAREDPPDAVLSDIELGPEDGVVACLRLRLARPDLRILVMTGDPLHANRAEAVGLGPVLSKPFTFEELAVALAKQGL